MELKSGFTPNWFTEVYDEVEKVFKPRRIFIDRHGYWNERMSDGTIKKYSKKEAFVEMHDGTDATAYPEYMRVNGFWLKINGLWAYPLEAIGYKNNRDTAQVLYTSKTIDEVKKEQTIYSETLILDEEKEPRIHVCTTVLDSETGVLKSNAETWVYV